MFRAQYRKLFVQECMISSSEHLSDQREVFYCELQYLGGRAPVNSLINCSILHFSVLTGLIWIRIKPTGEATVRSVMNHWFP